MSVWQQAREEFPALAEWTYLNTATFGQLGRRTRAAMERHLDGRDQRACSDFLTWFYDHDRLREKLGRFIHAPAASIAFVPNSNAALALLISGLRWRDGDEIVTLRNEFPNHIYSPYWLEGRGVKVHEVDWAEMPAVLNERTRLVLLSTVNYNTGFRVPLDELSALVRKTNAYLYLDGTQGLGALEFDFSRVQPDLFSVNCYKWMLAPNGAAFFAASERMRQEIEPLAIGWRSDRDWRNVDQLHHGAPRFSPDAERYEGGMLPSLVLYGLEASVDFFMELGPATIERRVLELSGTLRNRLSEIGVSSLPYGDSAIVSADLPSLDCSAVAKQLAQEKILVSARHGRLRVSTHFYNSEADIDRLVHALAALPALR